MRLAKAITSRTLWSARTLRESGRPLDEQAQDVLCNSALDDLRLTAEADPVLPGTPLHGALGGVVQALSSLAPGTEFVEQLAALDAALAGAIESVSPLTSEDDTNIHEIVDELERAFLISLLVTLTSHTFAGDWSEKWSQQHQDFLAGRASEDPPHYVHMQTFIPCSDPGPGRVHVQHIKSALAAGTTVFIAGSSPTEVDHYPELQALVYSQWFAYMHAIWDEQFRDRIAAFFSTAEQQLERNDVVNDFFGDIRRVRNDYVHRKGMVDEAAKVKVLDWGFVKGRRLEITTEQMLSLVDLFPRRALTEVPAPRSAGTRKNIPGSVDAALLDAFLAKVAGLGADKNDALADALTQWLGSQP